MYFGQIYKNSQNYNDLFSGSLNNGVKSSSASSPTTISCSSWSISESDPPLQNNNFTTVNNQTPNNQKPDNLVKASNLPKIPDNKNLYHNLYTCSSKTFSDFSNADCKDQDGLKMDSYETRYLENDDEGSNVDRPRNKSCSTYSLSIQTSNSVRPNSLRTSRNGSTEMLSRSRRSSIRKSVSLFSSINSFSSAIYESATSLIGLKKENDDK